MRTLTSILSMLAMALPVVAQEDAAGRFFDDRMVDFKAYLDAREKMAADAAERKAVEKERAELLRRIEMARMGYTGLSPEEQAFWDSLKAELEAVLNLWQKSAEAEEEEKQVTRQAALAALAAAQNAYVAQMRFAMAQLGMAACVLDADSIKESNEILQRSFCCREGPLLNVQSKGHVCLSVKGNTLIKLRPLHREILVCCLEFVLTRLKSKGL